MEDPTMHIDLRWDGGLKFTSELHGQATALDGKREHGSSPMELLLTSIAGCMGIDIVHILERRRAEVRSMTAQVEGVRNESHPRRFTHIRLHFDISGNNIAPMDVERAIKLSRETYCSVYASLRPDIELSITYNIADAPSPGAA